MFVFTMNQQSLQPCCSSNQTSEVRLKADSVCMTTVLETADNALTKKSVEETTSTKSKAELRAERRALQVSKNISL